MRTFINICISSAALILGNGYALAQESNPPPKPPDMTLVPQESRPLYSNVRPEDLTKAQNEARELAQQITSTMRVTSTPAELETARGSIAVRSGYAIANKALAADRDAVLKALGVDLQKSGSLYVFVSKSMPENLLRSYMKEGMWAGAQLVVRGIPENQDIGTYIREQVSNLVQNKGAGAVLSIDPRLFDAYAIDVVPTIVYSEWNESSSLCATQTTIPLSDSNLVYTRCDQAPASAYWKVSGAVNIAWALSEFESNGAINVKAFKAAMSKGPNKSYDGRDQVPYDGDWSKEAGIEETNMLRAQAAAIVGANPNLKIFETSRGPAVGPSVLTVLPEKEGPK